MSKIQVNSLVNKNDDGAPELTYGATVPSGQVFSALGDVNVSGIITASSFSGNGSGLTNLSIATKGRSIAFRILFGPPENSFRS